MAQTSFTKAAPFLAPALIVVACVLAAPVTYSVVLSFFQTDFESLGQGLGIFAGAENYQALASDGAFWNALGLMGVFVVVTTVIEVALGLAVALYLDQVLRVPKIIETLLVVPMFVIPVVSGLTFRYLLDPGDGLSGQIATNLGLTAPDFAGDPRLAFVGIILQDVWRMWPFVFLILFSGLKALPKEPVEAVRLDGATTFQACRYVLLPMMRGPIAIAVALKVIESLKAFTEIYVMTGGGPGEATSILSMYIVKQAFTFFHLGTSTAASTVLLILGVAAAALFARLSSRRARVAATGVVA